MFMSFIHSMLETQRTWRQRMHERRMLMQMDSHVLQDIGLSSSDAWREAHKPFWKA